MGYCGCGTKGGKLRWGLVALFLVLGVAFIIGFFTTVSSCKVCTEDGGCKKLTNFQYSNTNGEVSTTTVDDEGRTVPATLEDCSRSTLASLFYLSIISFFLATIPCCFNCCFAKHPNNDQYVAQTYGNPAAPGVPAAYVAPAQYGQQGLPGAPEYNAPPGYPTPVSKAVV